MKIKPEYSLRYDEDICIVRRRPDGTEEEVCPLNDTAAMAWEGLKLGHDREEIIQAVTGEFGGAEPEQVGRDLDALIDRLAELGCAEP